MENGPTFGGRHTVSSLSLGLACEDSPYESPVGLWRVLSLETSETSDIVIQLRRQRPPAMGLRAEDSEYLFVEPKGASGWPNEAYTWAPS